MHTIKYLKYVVTNRVMLILPYMAYLQAIKIYKKLYITLQFLPIPVIVLLLSMIFFHFCGILIFYFYVESSKLVFWM